MLQTEDECLARDDLADRVGMGRDLIADRGPDEVGAIAVETLRDQQVDLTQVDETEVDRDLLGFRRADEGAGLAAGSVFGAGSGVGSGAQPVSARARKRVSGARVIQRPSWALSFRTCSS